MRSLLAAIYRRDPLLAVLGWIHVFFISVYIVSAPWDTRMVLGLNTWIKPMKWAFSFVIYLWTMALLVWHLPVGWPKRLIRWGVAACVFLEMTCIFVQGARATPSHFNVGSTFDAALFATMTIAALANTLLVFFFLAQLLWHELEMPRAYLMGMRLGIVLFLIGSLSGMVMLLNQGHTVGAPDGGKGLPFLGWSTAHGDLRIAHGFGIHALQVFPLLGWLVSRAFGKRALVAQLLLVAGAGFGYMALFMALFRMAVTGQPLFG